MLVMIASLATRHRIAELVPLWLEQETVYANSKHTSKNPQLTIYAGGLKPDGPAFIDLGQYLGRFATEFNHAGDKEYLLLKASQTLAKHTNAARALVSAVLQHGGLSRSEADKASISRLEERCLNGSMLDHSFNIIRPFNAKNYWAATGEPVLHNIDHLIDEDRPEAVLAWSECLLDLNTSLLVGYTALASVIAEPGHPSGDVKPWLASSEANC